MNKIAAYSLLLADHPLYFEKTANRFMMPVIGAIGGGAIGGITGAASTKDREKKKKRALLGGFGGAAIGGSAGMLLQKHVNKQRIKPISSVPSAADSHADSHDVLLILNASHGDTLEKLKTSGLSGLSKDELYRVTQALYKDTPSNIDKLRYWLTDAARSTNNTEYDAHVVRLRGVPSTLRGFDRRANQMDRLDGFRKLKEIGTKVEVGPRVPSDAYATGHYYGR